MVRKFSLLCIGLVAFLSAGGVVATWEYAIGAPPPTFENISLSLSPFEFAPEQILPGGEVEPVQPGQDHMGLIERILNEKDKSYGLNVNANGVLHKYLKNDGYIFSNQKVTGGNLKFILDVKIIRTGCITALKRKVTRNIIVILFQLMRLLRLAVVRRKWKFTAPN